MTITSYGRVGRIARARSLRSTATQRLNPLRILEYAAGIAAEVPDPIEWVVSDKYLDRPNLYPRQATALKIINLRDDMFTQYDYDVIGEWEQRFADTGYEGISPGILDRIRINKERGRPWFREVQGVIGRRGSKGYIGGLQGSYVTWNYMHRPGGPQQYYGIDRDKRLSAIVFAGKKEQAQANQWRDISNIIVGAPCFAPYISKAQTERLTIYAPTDILRRERQEILGVYSETDLATFEVIPAPSTVMAARGPASFFLAFDEQAHVVASTSNADAGAVYDSATPALDQFGKDGFIYAPSSPWTKQGKFFENWELAIEMEPNGQPAYPERMMLQLPSWGLYEDWDEADHLPLRPPKRVMIEVNTEVKRRRKVNGKTRTVTVIEPRQVETLEADALGNFRPLRGAVQSYDEDMKQLQRANPETFAVERLSRWADSLNAYLNPDKVAAVFKPLNGETLFVQTQGALSQTYIAHGDPSNVNKRFGWSMGHRIWVPDLDEDGQPKDSGNHHVVFDRIRCWDPADFPDHTLDYDVVMGDIEEDEVRPFLPDDVSFDQFNVPATVGRLRKFVAGQQFPKHVQVREVSRTRQLNWKHYELFKAAINLGWVHAPMLLNEPGEDGEDFKINFASSEAELELRFLEEKNGVISHPTSGPVQTKDIADTLCEVVVGLLGRQLAAFLGEQFDEISLGGSAPLGTDPERHTRPANDVGNRLDSLVSGRNMGRGMSAARGMRRR